MIRTFNYTNRKRIEQKDISLRLEDSASGAPRLQAALRLKTTDYPPEAAVYIDAYHNQTRQRLRYGTVGQIAPPSSTVLHELDLSGTIQFRILVVDESGKHALILGSGEGLKETSGDAIAENRSSLLSVVVRQTPVPWYVEFANDGRPTLVLSKTIPGALEKIRANPVFQALILPAAMREILSKIFRSEEIDQDSEVYLRWLEFVMQFAETEPNAEDGATFEIWVEEVVADFAERFQFCTRLAEAIKGGE